MKLRDKGLILFITLVVLIIPAAAHAKESRTLNVQDVKILIEKYIKRHTPWKEEQIDIHNINLPRRITILPDWDYEILPAPNSTLLGKTAFALKVNMGGQDIQTYWITADVGVWMDVVLTSKSMKYHQIIGIDDVYMGKKNLTELPPDYINDIEEVLGKRVKRFIGANRPITADMLEEPPLFKRGSRIFIIAESEALKITAIGVAREDGYKGKMAKVMNIQSRKEIIGEVVDSHTVRVVW